jgi:hypothetical protein
MPLQQSLLSLLEPLVVVLGCWDGILLVQHYEGVSPHNFPSSPHTILAPIYHGLQRREDAFHHRVLDVVVIVIVVSSAVCVLTALVAITTANFAAFRATL